jgi:hypothetical protein
MVRFNNGEVNDLELVISNAALYSSFNFYCIVCEREEGSVYFIFFFMTALGGSYALYKLL